MTRHRTSPPTPRPPSPSRAASPPAGAAPPAAPGARRDRGQAAIEFIGFVPLLLLLALAGVQLGLVAYTASQASTAARAGARYVSQDDDRSAQTGAGQAMSGWLADNAGFTESRPAGEVTVTATVQIPSVIPGVDFGSVEKSATMPRARD